MTEDDIRELLHEMRDEPVPAASLRRVRLRVAKRIWGVRLGLLAAAAGTLLAIFWPGETKPIPPPAPPVMARQTVPPLPEPAPVVRAVRKAPAARNELVIRIETPDPDVVILLVGD